jgi:hypothetical protein
LAPLSVRVVLDAEITAASWKTERGRRNSQLDSEAEPSEAVVGSTPHSRGTAQVGNRSSTIDRGQISFPTSEAAFPDLANFLDQSHGADGLQRLLRSPTATFRILFVFVVLSHARRPVLHFQVTEHPTQEWTMQQVREAFPWEHGCRYLLIVAPHSEKLFCLLPRSRTHLALAKDTPESNESSGEARTRAHRGDSSGRRTSPSLPAPDRLGIGRWCPAIMASEYLALVLLTTPALADGIALRYGRGFLFPFDSTQRQQTSQPGQPA